MADMARLPCATPHAGFKFQDSRLQPGFKTPVSRFKFQIQVSRFKIAAPCKGPRGQVRSLPPGDIRSAGPILGHAGLWQWAMCLGTFALPQVDVRSAGPIVGHAGLWQ